MKSEMIQMVNVNKIIFEVSILFSGVFILGLLFGAIVGQSIHRDDVLIQIVDQCNKFGAFYADENTKFMCQKVEK